MPRPQVTIPYTTFLAQVKADHVAPSILFIDEGDAVGRRRGAGIGATNDECEQTLNFGEVTAGVESDLTQATHGGIVAGRRLHDTQESDLHFLPLAHSFLLALVLLFVVLIALIGVGILRYAYEKMGVERRYVLSVLLLTLLGGYGNLPVAELPAERLVSSQEVFYFGMRYVIPHMKDWPRTVIAVNVGGAMVPTLLSRDGCALLVEPRASPAWLPVVIALLRPLGIICLVLVSAYVCWGLLQKTPIKVSAWEFSMECPPISSTDLDRFHVQTTRIARLAVHEVRRDEIMHIDTAACATRSGRVPRHRA